MTSSLVGSEMCIRDRLVASSTYVAAISTCIAIAVALAVVATILLAQPVSYTHLTLPTICSV
eukprot:6740979-Prorocentrum_lima.AAC.1